MLKNEKVVFTGRLDSMTRTEAKHLILALKGSVQSSVSKSTTLLVVGKRTIDLFEQDSRPKKIKAAEELNSNGHHIKLINEKDLLTLVVDHLIRITVL
ncbi:BRCT domain-containing protein [Marinilactibacillus psychrotolerans]|uniref:BRCT domain-containing protein n=2 Tax=Marinilactibacillus psychrotolerans TaxID=191770 RepID=A0A5R9BWY9_9LACT|nr:BRCT domain-containing protein [Marinilactibacillus psychrotolerans]TLQ05226.1 hypothetical protein FEZ48_12710 [Marinilactibacillus psychrotolerans]SJN19654.1 DNA polymerase III epsilon subunit (3'-5' exonuclease) containing BRCT domain [Marinilactibacillus psychrotolerans 42ea]